MRERESSVCCILFLFPPFLHKNKQDRHWPCYVWMICSNTRVNLSTNTRFLVFFHYVTGTPPASETDECALQVPICGRCFDRYRRTRTRSMLDSQKKCPINEDLYEATFIFILRKLNGPTVALAWVSISRDNSRAIVWIVQFLCRSKTSRGPLSGPRGAAQ